MPRKRLLDIAGSTGQGFINSILANAAIWSPDTNDWIVLRDSYSAYANLVDKWTDYLALPESSVSTALLFQGIKELTEIKPLPIPSYPEHTPHIKPDYVHRASHLIRERNDVTEANRILVDKIRTRLYTRAINRIKSIEDRKEGEFKEIRKYTSDLNSEIKNNVVKSLDKFEKKLRSVEKKEKDFDRMTITTTTEMDAIRRDLQELDAQSVTWQRAGENKLTSLESSIRKANESAVKNKIELDKNLNNQINTIKDLQLKKEAELKLQIGELKDKIQKESFIGNISVEDLSKIRDFSAFEDRKLVIPQVVQEVAKKVEELPFFDRDKYEDTSIGQIQSALEDFMSAMALATGKNNKKAVFDEDELSKGNKSYYLMRSHAADMLNSWGKVYSLIDEFRKHGSGWEFPKDKQEELTKWVDGVEKIGDVWYNKYGEINSDDFFQLLYPPNTGSRISDNPQASIVNAIVRNQTQIEGSYNVIEDILYKVDMSSKKNSRDINREKRELGRKIDLNYDKIDKVSGEVSKIGEKEEELDKTVVQQGGQIRQLEGTLASLQQEQQKNTRVANEVTSHRDAISNLAAGLDAAKTGIKGLYDVHSERASRRSIGSRGKQANIAKPYDVAKTFLNNYLSIIFGRYV